MGFRHMIDDIYLLETPAGEVWSGIILVDGREKVLIDSGEGGEHIDALLVPAMEEMGYALTDIAWLLNTHCHGDHVGGHKRVVELGNVKVAAYGKSVPKLRDPMKYSKRIRAVWPDNSPPAPLILEGVEADRILEDGEVIAGRLKLVAAPGHDEDSVCFFDLPTKTLIAGDSLQGNGTVTQGTALYMDLSAYRSTLQRLEDMGIKNIISGHPYLITGEAAYGAEAAEDYLKKCKKVTQTYEDFLKKRTAGGTPDLVTLAKELIVFMGNRMPEWLFLPLYTVRAHMNELQKKM